MLGLGSVLDSNPTKAFQPAARSHRFGYSKRSKTGGLRTRLVICRLQRLDDVVRTYTFCIIQKVQAVTTSSNLCSLPFHFVGMSNCNISHMIKLKCTRVHTIYWLSLSQRSTHLLCCGGGVGGLVSVGWTGLEEEREVRRLHTLSADPSRSVVTAEVPLR